MNTTNGRDTLRVGGLAALAALCVLSFGAAGEEKTAPGDARADLHGDPLPPGALARLGTLRFRVPGAVAALTASPDGKWLAWTSDADGETLVVCDAASGKVVFQPKEKEESEKYAAAFSPDGRFLAASDGEGKIHLWKTGTWQPSQTLEGHEQGVISLSFARDGGLVSCDGKGVIHVWDVVQGQSAARIELKEEQARAVALSPDGQTLAAGCAGGDIVLVDPLTGQPLRKLEGHDHDVTALAFAPGGKGLGSSSADNTVRYWDLETGVSVFAGESGGQVNAVAFTPDGKSLVSGDDEGQVCFWNVATGQEVRRFVAGTPDETQEIKGLALAPDGKTLYAAGGNLIWRWNMETGERLQEPPGHAGRILRLVFSPDGSRVASTGADGALRVWDAATGRALHARKVMDPDGPPIFSPDGRLLAHAGEVLAIWEAETGRPVACGKGVVRNGEPLFHPDGRTILGISQNALACWDAASGRLLRTNPWPQQEDTSTVRLLPDGQAAVRVCNKKLLFIETAGGRVFGETDVPWDNVGSLVPSADGGLVYGMGDQELAIWEVASARKLHSLPVDGSPSVCALSRDGRYLVLAARSGKLPILNAFSGAKLLELEDRQRTSAVAFSPDGRRLATGGEDTTILIWDWEAIARRLPAPPPAAAADLERWFAALGGEDDAAACEAFGKLLANGAASVAFLKERLRPVTPDPERMRQLIAELDHEDFNTREKAAEALRDLGPPAEPALRRALAENQSTEVQTRTKKALDAIALPLVRSRELLRNLRVIRILEGVGTAEAAGALETFTRAAPETREGRAAGAAAERLRKAGAR